jgi:hypothetical protein
LSSRLAPRLNRRESNLKAIDRNVARTERPEDIMTHLRRLAALAVPVVMAVAATPLAAAAASPAGAEPLSTTVDCNGGGVFLVTGNWDGVGGDGIGVVLNMGNTYRWLLRNGSSPGGADYDFDFGVPNLGDIPVVGNWDGIGGDGVGVVRPLAGQWQWHLRNGLNAGPAENIPFLYGSRYDTPVTGNWDGRGGDGPGVVSSSGRWQLREAPNRGAPDYNFTYAPAGSAVGYRVTGNWDGIGGDGIGIVPVASGENQWRLRNGPNGGETELVVGYGGGSACAVTGNWDGIGGDGIGAVYYNGIRLQWALRNSATEGNPDYAPFLFP